MPHGQTDWGQYAGFDIIASLSDLGEAVSRLGSINLYDRRGNVIWWDDFETGLLGYLTAANGALGNVTWQSGIARLGRYSTKLDAGTVAGDFASIQRNIPFATQSRVGLEFAFSTPQSPQYIELQLTHQSSGVKRQGALRLYKSDGAVKVSSDFSAFTQVGSMGTLINADYAWQVIKLVLDFKAATFARAVINNTQFDLAQALGTGAPGTNQDFILFAIILVGNGVANRLGNIDDIIVTINEP